MKFRYYLRGAGVGVLVSTVILMIAFSKYKPQMSADDIIKEAKKLGMVMSEYKDGYVKDDDMTQSDDEPSVESGDEQNQDGTEENGGENGSGETSQNPNDNGTQSGESSENENGGNSTERTYVVLVIASGDTSEVVSQKLLTLGVIEDKDDFNKWLCITKGLGSKIICGTFEVPKDATYDEIAEIITN